MTAASPSPPSIAPSSTAPSSTVPNAAPGAAPASTQPLALKDVHLPPAPTWWPPAPGWWLLPVALVVAVLAVRGVRRLRRRRASTHWGDWFDDAVRAVPEGPARVAAISEILRRAARLQDAAADRLEGEAWLRFLDVDASPLRFDGAVGALLLDGGFRPQVDRDTLARLQTAARERLVSWMAHRPSASFPDRVRSVLRLPSRRSRDIGAGA